MEFNFENFLLEFDFNKQYKQLAEYALSIDVKDLSRDRDFLLILHETAKNKNYKALESCPEPKNPILKALLLEQLARGYFFGIGVIKSYKKCFEYASNILYASRDAKYYTGFMYLHGHYLDQDYNHAFKLLIASAMQGDAEAHQLIGNMNELGLGMPINKPLAYAWYNIASNLKPDKEEFKKKRDDLEIQLTNKEIDFAQNIASELIDSNYRKLRSLGFLLDY